MLHVRTRRPVGHIPPCLPSRADRPPSGPEWLHEIKHDGFRIMARRDDNGVRLYTRNGYDFAGRFPQIVEAVAKLKVRSCFIDGEAIVVDERGLSAFDLLRSWRHDHMAVLCAFDLIELDGKDLRRVRPAAVPVIAIPLAFRGAAAFAVHPAHLPTSHSGRTAGPPSPF
jgi:ATP-dependent DNA ligase